MVSGWVKAWLERRCFPAHLRGRAPADGCIAPAGAVPVNGRLDDVRPVSEIYEALVAIGRSASWWQDRAAMSPRPGLRPVDTGFLSPSMPKALREKFAELAKGASMEAWSDVRDRTWHFQVTDADGVTRQPESRVCWRCAGVEPFVAALGKWDCPGCHSQAMREAAEHAVPVLRAAPSLECPLCGGEGWKPGSLEPACAKCMSRCRLRPF